MQRGLRGVQIVAPRSISAWAKSPARSGGRQRGGQRLERGLGPGQRVLEREQARDHALDIAVDHRRAPSKAIAAMAAAV